MPNVIHHKYIDAPAKLQGDGISLHDNQHWEIHHCIVDFSNCDLDSIDEALGITLGSSAHVHDCVFRGAGKLVLLGCGDSPSVNPDVTKEYGKCVTFERCLFENFGRRGPEVQDMMEAVLTGCVIRNWGSKSRFTERAFGAWAHNGSKIIAQGCVFEQNVVPGLWLWLRDHIGHIGQAWNDDGIFGLFSRDAWLSGYRRALTADTTSTIKCRNCRGMGNGKLVLDGVEGEPMSETDAWELIIDVDKMAFDLEQELKHAN